MSTKPVLVSLLKNLKVFLEKNKDVYEASHVCFDVWAFFITMCLGEEIVSRESRAYYFMSNVGSIFSDLAGYERAANTQSEKPDIEVLIRKLESIFRSAGITSDIAQRIYYGGYCSTSRHYDLRNVQEDLSSWIEELGYSPLKENTLPPEWVSKPRPQTLTAVTME